MLHFHLSTTPICSKIHFIIEGLPQISRILFRCKQRGFSFGFNGKTPKESKIREIREIRVRSIPCKYPIFSSIWENPDIYQ